MNRIEKFFGVRNEAKLRYLDGEFEVLSPGEYVSVEIEHTEFLILEREQDY